ncbi:MAG TPA: ribbon-helix-helix domain-containing protein [bacterium]|jgi:metal-responsive CopG/Arc/MetJ family transcriptional regulator|nr:ribbon-helix-helix domain-containing protein [bacterium]
MASAKIAISLDKGLLAQLDDFVGSRTFGSRSQAVQEAIRGHLGSHGRHRLARELAKLDPKAEARLADFGLGEDLKSWPEY